MIIKKLPFQDPCVIYEKLRSLNSVLLESQKNGEHSYIALNPYLIFKSKGNKIKIINTENNQKVVKKGNPLKELERIILEKKIKRKKNWPLFCSGCVGYFGYDLVSQLGFSLPKKQKDDLRLPDIYLIFPKDILCFDHKNKTLKLICQNKKDVKKIEAKIKVSNVSLDVERPIKCSTPLKSNFTLMQYKKAINKCKKYIKLGHSYQIKISQRFQFKIKEDPWGIYKKLKTINPSPYAAFLNFEDCTIASNSPEHLVKVERGNIETRPIGGTYPRGKDTREDKMKLKKFMLDTKESAEHNMLIDLERNDLGRVARFGSVKVNEKKTIETYSHLFHIVTNIKARLDRGKNIFDCFRSMFPGGTITGCPKKRTMEIINEIESVVRGPYTGSIGFMNFSNEMDLNIIIRSLIVKDGVGCVQVGGGVVADSDAKREYDETVSKAGAIFQSILMNST